MKTRGIVRAMLWIMVVLIGQTVCRAQQPELVVQTGHSNWVYSVAFSPDGKLVASGSDDSTLKLWEVASGKLLRTLEGYPGEVTSVVFSADGRLLASGDGDGPVRLWDVASGKLLRTLEGHSEYVTSVALSADGKLLASGSWDKTVKLWNVASGKLLRTLEGHSKWVTSVVFSADSKLLASASDDKTVKLWEVEGGKLLRTLEGHSKYVASVALSTDGKLVASGSWDKTVKLWGVESGKELRTLEGHSDHVTSVALSADGKLLASASEDNTVKLWDVESGKLLRTIEGHSSGIDSVGLSADGKVLASGSWDDTVKLWDVESGKLLHTLEGHSGEISSVALSVDGKLLAGWGGDKTVKLWDLASGAKLRTLEGHSGRVSSVEFSPDGKLLASGSGDKTVRLWEVESGKLLRALEGYSGGILMFSADGKLVANESQRKTLQIWDVESGKELHTLDPLLQTVFSPNLVMSFIKDPLMMVITNNGNIHFTNLFTKQKIATLTALDKSDWTVTTPDGRFDTSKSLDDIEGIHWVMSDDPLKALPLEIFMRDYYEPRLLPRLLDPQDRARLKPIRNIATINRLQPAVSITGIESQKENPELVTVVVEVSQTTGEVNQQGGGKITRASGVYDLRLFRDGQLVKQLPERINPGESDELLSWRQSAKVELSDNGKKIVRFENIKLPRKAGVEQVEFSAYAFNEDRVKSSTAKKPFMIPKTLTARKGRAYILTVGVNAYESESWNLKFAARDARLIQQTLYERLSQSKEYEEVVQIPLISDDNKNDRLRLILEKPATKANFKAVLDLLSGKKLSDPVKAQIPNASKIQQARPEDLLVIAFASHGDADKNGNFYFFPYDIGKNVKTFTDEVLRRCISSEELSLWLRDVDAGEMVMIVDACHSAATVQTEGFKPGPMGSRGLGQLAYDKGMRILAASQADDVALESELIRQGLLTYALINDGINARQADREPTKDGRITLAEWLGYALKRVPELYEEVKRGKVKSFGRGRERAKLAIIKGESLKRTAQQPSLFDFTRGRKDVLLVE